MLRGHPQMEMYRLIRILAVPSADNSAALTAYIEPTETISEKKDVVLPRDVTGRGPK